MMGKSFWQNNIRLVTHIIFELQPIIMFTPVANFGDQSLVVHASYFTNRKYFIVNLKQIFVKPLWEKMRQV